MTDLATIILLSIIIVVSIVLGWWLLIASEGVYLGRRVVVWLYDLYAGRYDGVKNYYPEYEQLYLANPIMEAVEPQKNPLVLDVATGTGRVPLALARQPEFDGFTIGVDLSRKMLHHAAKNIYPYDHRAALIWAPAETLPFPDNSFDIVTCLEALEFMANPEAVLSELVRVLRPGGLLLVSQRINTRFMPGKTWSSGQILQLLEQNGIENPRAQIWQVDYRKVWGHKGGESPAIGVRPTSDILRCPNCRKGLLKPDTTDGVWQCENCGQKAQKAQDGVIELFPLYH